MKIYRLDNYVYPTTEQGLEALVTPSSLEPEPRNFKQGGYLSELPMTRGVDRTCTCRRVSIGRQTSIRWAPMACQAGSQNADIGNWNQASG